MLGYSPTLLTHRNMSQTKYRARLRLETVRQKRGTSCGNWLDCRATTMACTMLPSLNTAKEFTNIRTRCSSMWEDFTQYAAREEIPNPFETRDTFGILRGGSECHPKLAASGGTAKQNTTLLTPHGKKEILKKQWNQPPYLLVENSFNWTRKMISPVLQVLSEKPHSYQAKYWQAPHWTPLLQYW